MALRIGQGFDIHNIVPREESRHPLLLGGVMISQEKGVEAHSDGDTLLHALSDASLGALGHEDIGDLFPPTDKEWKDISSMVLLEKVLEKTEYKKAWVFENIDMTIVLQSPHLGEKKKEIRDQLQHLLGRGIKTIPIAIKAKTFEKECPQIWVTATTLISIKNSTREEGE